MSFRKRNTPLNITSIPSSARNVDTLLSGSFTAQVLETPKGSLGVRPSPVDGRSTISTGIASLDGLLAGHAGLALGSSLLIEESGTTDYAGSLLRFYAAEGVVQGHQVHVVGMGNHWGRELPGVVEATEKKEEARSSIKEDKDKMKIAWRYERHDTVGTASRGPSPAQGDTNVTVQPFCHNFDLTKRLTLPSPTAITYLPIVVLSRTSPFDSVIDMMNRELDKTDSRAIHRLVIPSLLSPATYPESSSLPTLVLQFLHKLRALLRLHSTRLTAIISLPLTLFPRSTGLTRWIELLSDGVIELVAFPHTVDAGPPLSASGSTTAHEEKPQGMVRIHRLPVSHDRGGGGGIGGAGVGDDLAFTLSRRRFVIKPFSLPPVEGDQEAQHGDANGGKIKVDIDF